ncbi:MAG: hypothetical protein LC104_04895 [Bacteroidales bacterium]|nr:hypothetical protein [Bacteroidales bacterium]
MTQLLYRYSFAPHVPFKEVERTLLIAIWGAEGLHGESRVRLEAGHYFEREKRAGVIDASTPVGRDINRLFVGCICREFGERSFRVERIHAHSEQPQQQPQEICA